MKKRSSCLSGSFFAASSHLFFSRRSMRAQILTITTKLHACACVHKHTRTRTHTDSFSSFGPLPACVPALAKGERKKKESKRTDNRITHLNNYRAVFFPLFSSELCIAWINYWCYYCALRLCTVIYRCMEGRRTLNPYMVLSDIYGLVQE